MTENKLSFKMGIETIENGEDWPTALLPGEIGWGENSNPTISKNRTYSTQWAWMDSEERYDKDIANGIKHTYKKDDFYYDINANGFRCDNFDTMDFTKKSIIYLGCSYTYGIGLPEEHCWPMIMHNKIQEEHNTTYNYINLGVPGGGVDWYLHFLPYFSKFNPAFIISADPEVTRMNWVSETGELIHLTPQQVIERPDEHLLQKNHNKRLVDAYKKMILEEKYFEYKKEVIFANIDSVAKILNSKFITMKDGILSHDFDAAEATSVEIARDNAHFNKARQAALAKMAMDKIKGNE